MKEKEKYLKAAAMLPKYFQSAENLIEWNS